MFNVAIVIIWRIREDETRFAAKMRFKLDICSVFHVIAVNDLSALAAEIHTLYPYAFRFTSRATQNISGMKAQYKPWIHIKFRTRTVRTFVVLPR